MIRANVTYDDFRVFVLYYYTQLCVLYVLCVCYTQQCVLYTKHKFRDIDIAMGTNHRIIAFKLPLNFSVFLFTLQVYGHTGCLFQY